MKKDTDRNNSMTEKYCIQKLSPGSWQIIKSVTIDDRVLKEYSRIVTDPEFKIADIEAIFEGASSVQQLREAGLI